MKHYKDTENNIYTYFDNTFDEEGKPIIEYLDPKFDPTCMKVGSAIRSVAMKDLSYLPTKG